VMMLLWLPLLLLVPLLFVWLLRAGLLDSSLTRHVPQGSNGAPDGALEIARQRLARGEIDSAGFEEIRRTLAG
jgi:uncharacterized membrane protein